MILSETNFQPDTLLAFFGETFPERKWQFWDMNSDCAADIKPHMMGFYIETAVSKPYPLAINLMESNEDLISEYQTKIARALSRTYQIKTVIDFTHPDHPYDPYYSLLYDKGDCFLVSDSLWEESEEFIIIGPWDRLQ
ncbi:MAG: hypothetical protein ACPGVT_06080 [Maricaulaceae bacterium]